MAAARAEGRFLCGYVIYFKDAGDPESRVLGSGTFEECERIGEVALAVSYSGPARPVDRAEFCIVHDRDVCDTCGRSGVEIARTVGGKTVCVDCDHETQEEGEADAKHGNQG